MTSLTIDGMIERLNQYRLQEKKLQVEIIKMCATLEQIQEDIDMMQLLIKHQKNKLDIEKWQS